MAEVFKYIYSNENCLGEFINKLLFDSFNCSNNIDICCKNYLEDNNISVICENGVFYFCDYIPEDEEKNLFFIIVIILGCIPILYGLSIEFELSKNYFI